MAQLHGVAERQCRARLALSGGAPQKQQREGQAHREQHSQAREEMAAQRSVQNDEHERAASVEHSRGDHDPRGQRPGQVRGLPRLLREGERDGGGAGEAAQEPGQRVALPLAEEADEEVTDKADRRQKHHHETDVARVHRLVGSEAAVGKQGQRDQRDDAELQDGEDLVLRHRAREPMQRRLQREQERGHDGDGRSQGSASESDGSAEQHRQEGGRLRRRPLTPGPDHLKGDRQGRHRDQERGQDQGSRADEHRGQKAREREQREGADARKPFVRGREAGRSGATGPGPRPCRRADHPGSRLPARYRHERFPAPGTARKVIDAGASVTLPAETRAPSRGGSVSPSPSVSAMPLRSTARLNGSREVSVYRSAAAGTVTVCAAARSVLMRRSATPPGLSRKQCA